jgi:hypothetical protein
MHGHKQSIWFDSKAQALAGGWWYEAELSPVDGEGVMEN